MDKIQPEQLGGLLFAVALVVAAVLAFNWRSEIAAFGRAAFSLARNGLAYLFYVARRTEPPAPRSSPQTEPASPVLLHPDQIGAAQSVDIDAVIAFLSEHNLTEEQGLAVLALIRRAPGDYFLSANKIRDGVGGSRDEVLAQIAARRPKPPAPRPAARIERPANGW